LYEKAAHEMLVKLTPYLFQGEEMATFKYPLSKLVQSDDLTLKLQTHELPEWKGRIIFAAQLKYLAKPPNTGKRDLLNTVSAP